MLEQAPGRTCGPMERGAHDGADLLAGLVTLWGTHAGAVCPEGVHPMGRTPAGEVHEGLQTMGRTHVGGGCGELPPMGGIPLWCRGRV